MQLMAYYGSVKCVKYALIDGSFDDNKISEYAVAGGNLEIIYLLEQKGVSFDGCFDVFIKFHRYEISEWLFRNYKCKIELKKMWKYYNYRMLYFCIENKKKCELALALILSINDDRIDVVKYIIENFHADIDTKDINNSLINASSNGHIDIVKYLIENCHADFNNKDISRLSQEEKDSICSSSTTSSSSSSLSDDDSTI